MKNLISIFFLGSLIFSSCSTDNNRVKGVNVECINPNQLVVRDIHSLKVDTISRDVDSLYKQMKNLSLSVKYLPQLTSLRVGSSLRMVSGFDTHRKVVDNSTDTLSRWLFMFIALVVGFVLGILVS